MSYFRRKKEVKESNLTGVLAEFIHEILTQIWLFPHHLLLSLSLLFFLLPANQTLYQPDTHPRGSKSWCNGQRLIPPSFLSHFLSDALPPFIHFTLSLSSARLWYVSLVWQLTPPSVCVLFNKSVWQCIQIKHPSFLSTLFSIPALPLHSYHKISSKLRPGCSFLSLLCPHFCLRSRSLSGNNYCKELAHLKTMLVTERSEGKDRVEL